MKTQIWVGWLLLSLLFFCPGTTGYASAHALLEEDASFPTFSVNVPPSTQPGSPVTVAKILDDQNLNGRSNATNQLVRRLHPDCDPKDFEPKYFEGPDFCGFPDHNKYNMANVAYLDAMTLARAALRVLRRCDRNPSLMRYFDIDTPGVRDKVTKVLEALVGPERIGAAEFQDPGFEYEVWYQEVPDDKRGSRTVNCDDPTRFGYAAWDAADWRRNVYTVMCPLSFHLYTPSLRSLSCNDIPSKAGKIMMCPGSMLLHEFMHWKRLTMASAGIEISDWNRQKDPAANPQSGYGPENAEALQRLTVFGKTTPMVNADSYAWFALEAYWSEKCSKPFGESEQVDIGEPFNQGITSDQLAGTTKQ